MLFLILALITVLTILAVFVFNVPASDDLKYRIEEAKYQEKLNENVERNKKLKERIVAFEAELKKEKDNNARLEDDLNKILEREAGLLNEKKLEAKEKEKIAALNKELEQARRKLADKDKLFDAEYLLNLKLKKELDEKKNEVEVLKKYSRKMSDYVRKLELESNKLNDKISEQGKLIAELEKKQEETNWVSKKEYFMIEKELSRRIEEVERLHLELSQLREKK